MKRGFCGAVVFEWLHRDAQDLGVRCPCLYQIPGFEKGRLGKCKTRGEKKVHEGLWEPVYLGRATLV